MQNYRFKMFAIVDGLRVMTTDLRYVQAHSMRHMVNKVYDIIGTAEPLEIHIQREE